MSDVNRFVWLAVIAFGASTAFPFLQDIWLSRTYGPSIPDLTQVQANALRDLVAFGPRLVAAIWLYAVSRAKQTTVVGWTLFGLFAGLIAVVLFYAVAIYDSSKPASEKAPLDASGT